MSPLRAASTAMRSAVDAQRLVLAALASGAVLCACAPALVLTTQAREAPRAEAAAPAAAIVASPDAVLPGPAPAGRGASVPLLDADPTGRASSHTPQAAPEPKQAPGIEMGTPEPKQASGIEMASPEPKQRAGVETTARDVGSVPSAAPPAGVVVEVTSDPAPVGSLVLGDSVILSAGVGPVLQERGYVVAGTVGQGVSDGYLLDYLPTEPAQAAPAWVIALGTNNPGDPGTVARLEGWLDLIDSLRNPDDPQHVFWVLPYRPAEYHGPMDAFPLDAFNAELVRLAEERAWLTVLDFAGAARVNPQWFAADTAMHLHPDAEGQSHLVRLIAGE